MGGNFPPSTNFVKVCKLANEIERIHCYRYSAVSKTVEFMSISISVLSGHDRKGGLKSENDIFLSR